MNVEESVKDAINKGDVKGIRIMMKNSLLVDPTFREFSEMELLTKDVNGLYEVHDGRVLETDMKLWDDDYMNKMMVQIVGNFSPERVTHLKNIVQHLRPISLDNLNLNSKQITLSNTNSKHNQNRQKNYYEQKLDDKRNNRIVDTRNVQIATGVVVGGAVGGATAALIGGSVLLGAAVGSVTLGVVVAVYTNEG